MSNRLATRFGSRGGAGIARLIGVDPGPLAVRVQPDNYAVISTLGAAWSSALGANLAGPEQERALPVAAEGALMPTFTLECALS